MPTAQEKQEATAFKRLVQENAALNNTLQRVVEDKLQLNAQYEALQNEKFQLMRQIEMKDEEIVQIRKKLGFDRSKADESRLAKHAVLEEMEQLRREMKETRAENEELVLRAKKEEESRAKAWEAVVIRDKQLQTLQKEHFALLNKLGEKSSGPLIVDMDGDAFDTDEMTPEQMAQGISQDEVNAMREANLSRLSKEKRLFLENVKLVEENQSLKHQVESYQKTQVRLQAATDEATHKMSQVEKSYKHTMKVLESEQQRRLDLAEENERLRLKIGQLEKETDAIREQLNDATKTKMLTKMVAAESVNEFSMRMQQALERVEEQQALASRAQAEIDRLQREVDVKKAELEIAESEKAEAVKKREEKESDMQALERRMQTMQRSLLMAGDEKAGLEKEIQTLKDEVDRTRSILRTEIEKNAEFTSQSEEVQQLRQKNQQVVQIWRSEEAQLLRVKQEMQNLHDTIKDLEAKNAQLRRVASEQQAAVFQAEEAAQIAHHEKKKAEQQMEEANTKLSEASKTRALALSRARELEGRENDMKKKAAQLEEKMKAFYAVSNNAEDLETRIKELTHQLEVTTKAKHEMEATIATYKTSLQEANRSLSEAKEELETVQTKHRSERDARMRAHSQLRVKVLQIDDLHHLLTKTKNQYEEEEKSRVKAQEELALMTQRHDELQAQLDMINSKLEITEHLRSVDLNDAKVLGSTMWAYSEEFQRKIRQVEDTRVNAHEEIKRLSALIRRLTAENYTLLQRMEDDKKDQVITLERAKANETETKELKKQFATLQMDHDALQKRHLRMEDKSRNMGEELIDLRRENSILQVKLLKQTQAGERAKKLGGKAAEELFQGTMDGMISHRANILARDQETELLAEQRLMEHLANRLKAEMQEADLLKFELREKEEQLHDVRRSLRMKSLSFSTENIEATSSSSTVSPSPNKSTPKKQKLPQLQPRPST